MTNIWGENEVLVSGGHVHLTWNAPRVEWAGFPVWETGIPETQPRKGGPMEAPSNQGKQ